jgi:hypothetical protein
MDRLSTNIGGKRHNMKKAVLAVTAASFLWFAGIGSALADQLYLTLTSGVSNNPVSNNVYVGPYPITVDGALSSLVCDDFSTEINVGDTWAATANTWNDLQNMKFTGNFGNGVTSAAQAYKEIFYLSAQMEQSANAAYVAPINYALWTITDPAAPAVAGSGPESSAYWLTQAAQNYQTVNTSDFLVYTPNPTSAAQEFILVENPNNAVVFESSPILLLGTGLLGCAGFSKFRRRSATRKKRESARLAEAVMRGELRPLGILGPMNGVQPGLQAA